MNDHEKADLPSDLELTTPPAEPLPRDIHTPKESPPIEDALSYYELMLLRGEKLFKVPVKEIIIIYD